MDRRELLGLGLGAATYSSTYGADGQTSQTPNKLPVRDLKASVTVNGTAFTYSMADGKDLENFFGLGFVQHNVRGARPSPEFNPAFEVYFRPDVAPSTRVEVVFEFFKSGDLAGAVTSNSKTAVLPAGVTAANITTPITIQVFSDGVAVPDHLGRTVIMAPTFWWGSRYRFQTTLRPIVKAPSDIVAARLFPPLGSKGLPGPLSKRIFPGVTYINPMDLAAIARSGGDTGERDDIGLTTEWAANYLINPTDPVAQAAMLASGEAASTWPIHWRDDATGAPINKLTYPSCNNYGWPTPSSSYQGSPCIWTGAAILNSTGQVQSGITPDVAHLDSLSYIPSLTTGDPFHLEEQQFAANYVLISNNNGFKGKAVVGISGGARAIAWSIRTIFEAWSATKQAEANGPLPPWLMPSSYYDMLLKDMVPFFEQWTNSTARWATVYHFLPNAAGSEPWENKYQAAAFIFGVLVGRTDYKAIAEWVTQDTINWTNGRTGAPPAYPNPYYFSGVVKSSPLFNTAFDLPPPTATDADFCPALGTAFVAWAQNDIATKGGSITTAQLAALQADPLNGGVLVQTQDDYVNSSRGVCAFATYLNTLGLISIPDAPACLDRMNKYVQGLHGGKGYAVARWAFLPSADGSLPAFTPLPKPVPLPSAA